MHTTCRVGTIFIVEDPPLTCIAAVWDCGEPTELVRIAAIADFGDNLRRENTLSINGAFVEHQQAKPPQVAQSGADAATGKGNTLAIDRLVSVLLGPHWPPQPFRCHIGYGLVGDTADNPAQHIGVDGLVMERIAMVAFGLHLLQIFPVPVWSFIVIRLGEWTGCF